MSVGKPGDPQSSPVESTPILTCACFETDMAPILVIIGRALNQNGWSNCPIDIKKRRGDEAMSGNCWLLRSWLRPHRGISQEKLPLSLGFFEFVHNVRKRGKALLGALIELLVS